MILVSNADSIIGNIPLKVLLKLASINGIDFFRRGRFKVIFRTEDFNRLKKICTESMQVPNGVMSRGEVLNSYPISGTALKIFDFLMKNTRKEGSRYIFPDGSFGQGYSIHEIPQILSEVMQSLDKEYGINSGEEVDLREIVGNDGGINST